MARPKKRPDWRDNLPLVHQWLPEAAQLKEQGIGHILDPDEIGDVFPGAPAYLECLHATHLAAKDLGLTWALVRAYDALRYGSNFIFQRLQDAKLPDAKTKQLEKRVVACLTYYLDDALTALRAELTVRQAVIQ
jgi:hypothetical protein